ncbi:hypothetical protein APHAL10511_007199 [Amanita phalloides]|nr:hypothetical protein APHAL10511_007199 [Amanita phalloides]
MKVAIQGCCHGDLDAIYGHVQELESKNSYTVDVLLICGDFQAVRNEQDLQCMAVPNKYKAMKDFHKYYTGERVAPVLTLVIGGNHEASNHLWELYHGGWLAPNIYYLGHAGCVRVNGVRIAGASGIFKSHDYRLGYHESLPYDQSTMRSAYHIREFAVRKLSLLSPPRIFMSHDWPQSIERYGDLQTLLRHKSFLRSDIESGRLGSPPLMNLLMTLKPEWWFAAHLHTYYEATVQHAACKVRNPDEIMIGEEEEEEEEGEKGEKGEEGEVGYASTKFVALDKCLPRRRDLMVIEVEEGTSGERGLTFDVEWLGITRAMQPWLSRTREQRGFPEEAEARRLVREAVEWVRGKVGPGQEIGRWQEFRAGDNSGQTAAVCGLVEMDNRTRDNGPI